MKEDGSGNRGGRGDRIFGLVMLFVSIGYIASATQIQTSFMTDPVGPKAFPILIGVVAALCSLVLIIKPDPDPDWPSKRVFGELAVTAFVLILYGFMLKPLGFLLPTAIASGVLSYQIHSDKKTAALTGIGLSIGLYLIFRYALGLSLMGFPRWVGF